MVNTAAIEKEMRRYAKERRDHIAMQFAIAAVTAGGRETAAICDKAVELADALIARLDG